MHQLFFFGALVMFAGLMPAFMVVNIRVYQRQGMTTGGAGWRRGEAAADYQRRSKELDSEYLKKARRWRPYGLCVTAVGLVMVIVAFV